MTSRFIYLVLSLRFTFHLEVFEKVDRESVPHFRLN